MPRYDYRNTQTGEVQEFFFSVAERPERFSDCDGDWEFDLLGTVRQVQTQSTSGYPHTLWGQSVLPHQVEAARKANPGLNYKDNGELVVGSYTEKKRVAKTLGLVDKTGEWKKKL